MISLYLIRHGECEGAGTYIGRGSDVSLTDEGSRGIFQISRILKEQGVKADLILSSPMRRAVQSAQIICDTLQTGYKLIPGLEECDFGRWEGRTFDQIAATEGKKLEEWIGDPVHINPPGGESLRDLQKRVRNSMGFINNLIVDEKKREIVVVSHRGPLIILLLEYLGTGLEHFWNYRMDRGSVTKINLYPRFAELAYLNLTAVP